MTDDCRLPVVSGHNKSRVSRDNLMIVQGWIALYQNCCNNHGAIHVCTKKNSSGPKFIFRIIDNFVKISCHTFLGQNFCFFVGITEKIK